MDLIHEKQKYFNNQFLIVSKSNSLSKISHIIWSANFAYCIGIIASDGNLSKDKRHIHITSKDLEIIENCRQTLKPKANTFRLS